MFLLNVSYSQFLFCFLIAFWVNAHYLVRNHSREIWSFGFQKIWFEILALLIMMFVVFIWSCNLGAFAHWNISLVENSYDQVSNLFCYSTLSSLLPCWLWLFSAIIIISCNGPLIYFPSYRVHLIFVHYLAAKVFPLFSLPFSHHLRCREWALNWKSKELVSNSCSVTRFLDNLGQIF